MSIGRRIAYFRKIKGVTQKWLGEKLGFKLKSADVRMAQYETGGRTPKEDMIEKIAYYLDVNPYAINIPDIESDYGFMHTLFVFEDVFGLEIAKKDDEICLTVSHSDKMQYLHTKPMLNGWYKTYKMYLDGKISQEQYNEWKYNYPRDVAINVNSNKKT